MALVSSMLTLVVLLAVMILSAMDVQAEVAAQATTTAAATTAAATTAAATTAAATTAAATTAAATTAAAAPVATTARPATAGATTAAATGRFTGLPFFTPNKAVGFNQQFTTNLETAIKMAGGDAVANAKYDGFMTSGQEAQIAAYYDTAMRGLGFTRQAVANRVSIPLQQLPGITAQVYIYNQAGNAYAVAILGPFTQQLLQTLAPAVTSGSPAPGDSLVVLVSDIRLGTGGQGGVPGTTAAPARTTAAVPAVAPASGIGGAEGSEGGLNPLWLVLPLSLVVVMSGVVLVARRRKSGN